MLLALLRLTEAKHQRADLSNLFKAKLIGNSSQLFGKKVKRISSFSHRHDVNTKDELHGMKAIKSMNSTN